MIRRIAVHRVWNVCECSCRNMQVVEVDAVTHCVKRVYPLVEEIRNTEWWGGLMIVSPVPPLPPKAEEDFNTYVQRMRISEGKGAFGPLACRCGGERPPASECLESR